MRKGATAQHWLQLKQLQIVALRNEKGSYSLKAFLYVLINIVALRNEKGSYS